MKCKERTKNDGLKRFANEMETAEGDENVNGDSPRPTSSSPSPESIDERFRGESPLVVAYWF
jgi:hypothetical protein